MPYVPAVDGLRALAVALVLLFHAKLPLVRGGFIGVDVFFVISGVLDHRPHPSTARRDGFSLLDFYERRIRRIFPALFLVLFATMTFGAAIMLPPDLIRLGSSVVGAALFVANFYFWEVRLNYLQDDPDFEPLLHTWSLAIEEQFYLLFPIFLLTLLRLSRRPGLLLFGAGLVSLALSVALSTTHPRAAFYFSFSRAWELLLGASLAATNVRDFVPRRFIPALQWHRPGHDRVCSSELQRATPFPGFAALLPCFGTALLIAWSHLPSRVVAALSNPALVWVGLISYPLYLWHLPLLVLARLDLLREPAPHEIALLYLAAVALGSRHLAPHRETNPRTQGFVAPLTPVHRRGRSHGPRDRRWDGPASGAGRALAAPPADVASILAAAKDFAPSRAACHNWDRKRPGQFADCVMGDSGPARIRLRALGRLACGSGGRSLDAVGRDLLRKGLQLTSDDCLPVLGVDVVLNGAVTDCAARNEATFALLLQHHVRRVILASAWFQYLGDYNKVLRLLGARMQASTALRC